MMRLIPIFALLAACAAPAPAPPAGIAFGAPQLVTIEGYDGDAMEPFLSRDGTTLFFNNRNDPAEQTDLHWATRIDDLHFQYRGKVEGANSDWLDGVPTLSAAGRFCFVSVRAYAQTLATIHCGDWTGDRVTNVQIQPKAAMLIPGHVAFDAELSADGQTLIIADGRFNGGPTPVSADLHLTRLADGAFDLGADRDFSSDRDVFANINTPALEYAAALSADSLTLSFTRLEAAGPSIWIARRTSPDTAFAPPRRITAITGFAEAATFAPDGAIYFHHRDGARLNLWRLPRVPIAK